MMGTFDCVYETPCHWCTKWDKKCDKKSGTPEPYDGLFNNVKSSCNHEWTSDSGGADLTGPYLTYVCKKCGMSKKEYI